MTLPLFFIRLPPVFIFQFFARSPVRTHQPKYSTAHPSILVKLPGSSPGSKNQLLLPSFLVNSTRNSETSLSPICLTFKIFNFKMGYLENLPAELLHHIFEDLDREDLRALRMASPAFISFVTPRVFSKIFLSGNPTVPKKLRCVLERPNLRRYLEEIVFYTSDLFNEVNCTEEAILRIKRIGRLLTRYEDLNMKILTVIGEHQGVGMVLAFLGLAGVTTIKHVRGQVFHFYREGGYVRLYPHDYMCIRPLLERLETLNLLVRSDAIFPSVLNLLHDTPNLQEFHLECTSVIIDHLEFGPLIHRPNVQLPVSLRKLALINISITWQLLMQDIFQAAQIEELCFLEVNLETPPFLYLANLGLDRIAVPHHWQKFVDDLDAKCSRSGRQMRLIVGWLTESCWMDWVTADIDDSRLRTVTLQAVDKMTNVEQWHWP